jgi:hypothetical protein
MVLNARPARELEIFKKEHLQRLNYRIFDLPPEATRRQGI